MTLPVCPEELVALLESIVEEHVDSLQCQLCVVDALRLLILHAAQPRGWFCRVRHSDTRYRRSRKEEEGGGAAVCVVSLLTDRVASAGGAGCFWSKHSHVLVVT